jgi:hypothetical protein
LRIDASSSSTATSSSGVGPSDGSIEPSSVSPSDPTGVSSETGTRSADRSSSICAGSISSRWASSSSVGSRPSSVVSLRSAVRIFVSSWPMCTGILIVREWC